jgi:hypothetical protein
VSDQCVISREVTEAAGPFAPGHLGELTQIVSFDLVDDPDSRVDSAATALADLCGVARLGRGLATGRLPVAALRAIRPRPLTSPSLAGEPVGLAGQAVRFAAIGVASTIAYLLLFAVARRDRRAASQPARPAEALLVPDAVKVDAWPVSLVRGSR